MRRKATLPDEVLNALAQAQRLPGWNNRDKTVRRFEVGCTLYVVPFRCWAYRRLEKQAAAWWRDNATEGKA